MPFKYVLTPETVEMILAEAWYNGWYSAAYYGGNLQDDRTGEWQEKVCDTTVGVIIKSLKDHVLDY